MCKGNKQCKACAQAQIGKTMAKKSRKSSSKSLVMDGLLYGGGVVAGGYLVPKVLEIADPSGKMDSKIINGLTAAAGLFGSSYVGKAIGAEAGKVTLGIGIGGVAALISELFGGGMGYVVNPNTDLERIVGDSMQQQGYAPDSRYNAGEL